MGFFILAINNLSLTKQEGYTGERWPKVLAVQTSLRSVHTKTCRLDIALMLLGEIRFQITLGNWGLGGLSHWLVYIFMCLQCIMLGAADSEWMFPIFSCKLVEDRLGTIIHGQLDQLERGVLFTDAFVARQMACIRGVFSAITKYVNK